MKTQSKMQAVRGADSALKSSIKWTELGKPQLDGKIRHLKAYEGHQLRFLGSLTCDIEGNGSRQTQKQLAALKLDKESRLLGRKLLPEHCLNNITTEHLPVVNGYKAVVELIPKSKPMFCKSNKIPLPIQDKVTEKQKLMIRQDILVPVQPGRVTKKEWQTETLCGLEIAYQCEVLGWGIPKTRH